MSDDVRITSPVSVENNTKEQVALELAKHIARRASNEPEAEKRDRQYYLKLYAQCLKATSGNSLKYILED